MMNTLLFGYGDVSLFTITDHYILVSFIFIVSMIAMPIVLLNMLIAIMGDSYELIQVCVFGFMFAPAPVNVTGALVECRIER